jgi:hypothetical protein
LKNFYCNSFEVSSNKEIACLILRFETPDGSAETIYVTICPSGVKALSEMLTKAIVEHEEKYGAIKPWEIKNRNGNTVQAIHVPYLA